MQVHLETEVYLRISPLLYTSLLWNNSSGHNIVPGRQLSSVSRTSVQHTVYLHSETKSRLRLTTVIDCKTASKTVHLGDDGKVKRCIGDSSQVFLTELHAFFLPVYSAMAYAATGYVFFTLRASALYGNSKLVIAGLGLLACIILVLQGIASPMFGTIRWATGHGPCFSGKKPDASNLVIVFWVRKNSLLALVLYSVAFAANNSLMSCAPP